VLVWVEEKELVPLAGTLSLAGDLEPALSVLLIPIQGPEITAR
jgi:hypothetical protein